VPRNSTLSTSALSLCWEIHGICASRGFPFRKRLMAPRMVTELREARRRGAINQLSVNAQRACR